MKSVNNPDNATTFKQLEVQESKAVCVGGAYCLSPVNHTDATVAKCGSLGAHVCQRELSLSVFH